MSDDKKEVPAGQVTTAEEETNELMPNEELNAEDSSATKLPDKETKSGEEDEDVVFKARCKSYRFDEGENEWKERGTGEIRLLKHRETNVSRMLLRREQILKIALCVNLCECGPLLEGSSVGEKGWVVSGMDYSEDEDATRETFCLRFTSKENAQEFKKNFLDLGGPAKQD